MDHNDLFVCALSGVEAPELDILPDEMADDLGLLPVGWTRLVIERRLPNPDWQEVQQVKAMMVEAATQQIPEDQRVPEATRALQIQVAAQYAALEDTMSPFLNMKEVLFVAPPEVDPSLAKEFYSIRDRLGLPVPPDDDDDDEDKEDEPAEAPEDAPVEDPVAMKA
jgi:hypothetical protein